MDARGGIGGSLTGLDLRAEIDQLRKERNAVILAHYYQKPEIQDLADFVGDSLDLSKKAAATDADVIAFCGVRFMAETAKILSPDKIVVLPDMDAGCSLEDSCPPDQFAAFRAAHPDHIALTYINCSTEVKALSDVIVTSSSAEKILSQIPLDQKIIFGPDKNLGGYLARKTGREMLLWPGVCIVHEAFSETELLKLQLQHPGAPVAAHPECPPYILDHADYVGSTSGILAYADAMAGDTLIVATEPHIIHQMEKALPENFIGAPVQTAVATSALTWRSIRWRSSTPACAISNRGSRSRKACASRPSRASTACSKWPAARSARAIWAASGNISRRRMVARLALAAALFPPPDCAQYNDADDPYIWLEEIQGERALAKVDQWNADTEAVLTAQAEYPFAKAWAGQILDDTRQIMPDAIKVTVRTCGATRTIRAGCGG